MSRRSRRGNALRGGVGSRVALAGLLFGLLAAGPSRSCMGAPASGPGRGGESTETGDSKPGTSAGVVGMAENPAAGGDDAIRTLIRRAFRGTGGSGSTGYFRNIPLGGRDGLAGLRDNGEPAEGSEPTDECAREEAEATVAASAANGRGVGMDKCTGVPGNNSGQAWCTDTYFGGRAGCCFDAATGACFECLAAPDCTAAKLGCAERCVPRPGAPSPSQ